MNLKSGSPDKRGINSASKALDYLVELNEKHLNDTDKKLQVECIDYLKEHLKDLKNTQAASTKKINELNKTVEKYSKKIDKLLKKISPEKLMSLFKEI